MFFSCFRNDPDRPDQSFTIPVYNEGDIYDEAGIMCKQIEHARFVQQFAAKWGWCGTTATRGGCERHRVAPASRFSPPGTHPNVVSVLSPHLPGLRRYFKRSARFASTFYFPENFYHCKTTRCCCLGRIDSLICVQQKSTSETMLVIRKCLRYIILDLFCHVVHTADECIIPGISATFRIRRASFWLLCHRKFEIPLGSLPSGLDINDCDPRFNLLNNYIVIVCLFFF